jgi:hypothetical protein
MLRICFIILLTFFFSFNKLRGQDNLGLKFFGLSIHPKGEIDNAEIMPLNPDGKGYFVMNLGGMICYEHFISKDLLSIKAIQALYSDCAARFGGFTHFGFRVKIFRINRHSLYGGLGPTLIYRRNWMEITGYVNPKRFKGEINDKWQYKFVWYGAELEYSYSINKRFDIATTFVPGYPNLMSLSLGIKYKLKIGE